MSTNEPKLPARDVLPERVAKAIEEILGYLWEAEKEHFTAQRPGPDEEHIFRALAVLDGWFYGHEASPEELVAELFLGFQKNLNPHPSVNQRVLIIRWMKRGSTR